MKEQKSYRFDSLEERQALVEHFGEDYFSYIPTMKHECSGFLYHNHSPNSWTSASLKEYKDGDFYAQPHHEVEIVMFKDAFPEYKDGDFYAQNHHEVEIVMFKDAFPDYTQACSYIGKNIQWKNEISLKVIGFCEYDPYFYQSTAVAEYAVNNKNFIVLICEGRFFFPMCDKVTIVPDKPTSISVKLNRKHEAVVTKDSIKVGCQTFPISILEELNEAHAKL